MAATPAPADDELIAIDVLIEPGPVMLAAATAWNARLREQSPGGFAFDAAHAPHVTLLQRFVARSDLPAILAAVDGVKATFDVASLDMTATGLYHIPSGELGLAGITVERSAALSDLQRAVIAAVDPYARTGGGESAFVPDPTGAPIEPFMFDYVETFVPRQAGEHFKPHLTIGLAPLGWLEEAESRSFEPFHFGATGIATYQLGNFGTAAKRLERSD